MLKIGRVNRHYLIRALKYGLTEITHSDPTGEAVPVLVCQSPGRKLVVAVLGESKEQTQPASTAPVSTPETKEPNDEERTDMPRTSTKTNKSAEPSTSLIDQVEQIKDALKNVVRDLSNLVDAVKLAEKEQRASEKEVEAARATLKKLQQVTI
jgi:hypothetical protein